MKVAVQKNHLWGQILNKSPVGPKKRRQCQFTETYIRAYYFTEDELESWLPKNRIYSKKQLTALVSTSGASLSKRTKQKLLVMIDEL